MFPFLARDARFVCLITLLVCHYLLAANSFARSWALTGTLSWQNMACTHAACQSHLHPPPPTLLHANRQNIAKH